MTGFKNVKGKKRIREQQRRNCNTLQINMNLKSRNLGKELHVSKIWKKQNLANTLKSYAMCNLQTNIKSCRELKLCYRSRYLKE